MLWPPSTRPSDATGRRSSALVHKLGFAAHSFPTESAGQIAAARAWITGQYLERDAVHPQYVKRPLHDQSGYLAAKPAAAQIGDEHSNRVSRTVMISIR
jgi:hypothetical protein